jgi:hypothetical protein
VQIGLVLLMALSAKNAILIVEFARELHAKALGRSFAGRPIGFFFLLEGPYRGRCRYATKSWWVKTC